MTWHDKWVTYVPCCSGCPTHDLIGATDHPRSSQGHLVSSNWPVWSDQPTVHHSVWEDHFHSNHTLQYTFLLTIQHYRPGSGAGVLCKASRSYTEWKWYLQQLGVSDYLWRWESGATVFLIAWADVGTTVIFLLMKAWEQLYCMWYSVISIVNCSYYMFLVDAVFEYSHTYPTELYVYDVNGKLCMYIHIMLI